MVVTSGDSLFLELSNQLPRRTGIDTITAFQDFFTNNPKLKIFAQQSKHVRGIDNCDVIVEVFDIISQEYEACVMYNVKTPEQAIADAEKAVNVLLGAR